MAKVFVRKGGNGVADGTEVVDDGKALDAQTLLHQRRADHPRIVGELQDFAADRAGERQGKLIRQIDLLAPAELLPRELEAGMIGRVKLDGLTERNDPT